jgi:hypothetical protein
MDSETPAEGDEGRRRSSRNAGKSVDYKNIQIVKPELSARVQAGLKGASEEGPLGREDGVRINNP